MSNTSPLSPRSNSRRRSRRKPQAPEIQPVGLEDEIDMLRSMMRRAAALADESCSLDEILKLLDTLSKASTRLAGLIKAEQQFAGNEHDFGSALNQAIGEVLNELKKEG